MEAKKLSPSQWATERIASINYYTYRPKKKAQLYFWDSLIVAAAERAGCARLLSEDFEDGRSFEAVTVVNPFVHTPDEFGLRI